jgi:hypothetical protein
MRIEPDESDPGLNFIFDNLNQRHVFNINGPDDPAQVLLSYS